MTTSDEWAERLGLGTPLTPSQLASANMRVQNPTRKPRAVDPTVYELARSFCKDANETEPDTFFTHSDFQRLAEDIQDAIESWFALEVSSRSEGETP